MRDGSRDAARRRIEELRGYELAGPGAQGLAQDAVELAALLIDAPLAVVTIIGDGIAYHPATVGTPPWEGPLEEAMCAAILDEPGVVVVPDASADPRYREHPYVDGRLGRLRLYASAPLVTPRGVLIGRLGVYDTEPRDLTAERAHGLDVIAQGLISSLEVHLRTRQLEHTVDELTSARAELVRSNEELTDFASRVSHDLRNPLTAVLANAEALLSDPAVGADPGLAELATAAVDAGHRMELMIRQFLAYGQVGGRLRLTDVDLGAVLETVRADVRPLVARLDGTVRVGRLPVVRGDAGQLYAVFLNLVTNALKFAHPGAAPEVDVGAEPLSDRVREPAGAGVLAGSSGFRGPSALSGWRVTVADRGRGVPATDRHRIFQAFARGRHTDHREIEGSGIGLSVARRIVAAHGGRIGVEDRPGGGSVFWVELPAP